MELTEILVAVKQPDFQSTNPLSPAKPEASREIPRNEKSFSELLAGLSSENQSKPVKDEPVQAKSKEETVKTVKKDEEKPSSVESARNKPEEKVKKENPEENEKVSETSEKEPYSYLPLNLVREENFNAKTVKLSEIEVSEVGQISSNLLDKLAEQGDEERVRILTQGGKIEKSEDFEFEIVSDDAIALEAAQKGSVDSPLDFLNAASIENKGVQEPELKGNSVKKEESPLDKLKSKITVTDLRTEKPEAENTVTADEAEPKLKVTMTGNDSATVEMNLSQTQAQVTENITSVNSQVAASDGSNFQAMLQNQIQANASEIVRVGNIVLKDNNKGTIDLILHPDDIGSVKMTLSVDGDKITGHIAVNTKEALELFKNNAENLRDAFMKNGYENASFEVSYNASGNSAGQNFAEQTQQEQNMIFARREYGSLNGLADSVADGNFSEDFSDLAKFGINIVA